LSISASTKRNFSSLSWCSWCQFTPSYKLYLNVILPSTSTYPKNSLPSRRTKILNELIIHLTLPVGRSLHASRLPSSDDANNRPVDESYNLRSLLGTRKWCKNLYYI
jgi:hypothetical protein